MSILLGKYSILIPIVLLLAVIVAWQSPAIRLILVLLLLLFSLVRALASIVAKHRTARLSGRVTQIISARNILIETIFVLAVMILAGILGRHVAQLATQQISHDFLQFVAGIATGLLVGIGVGAALHPIWGKLVKVPADH
ncbi:MAG TPA: hypothetical protein VJ821_09500 [Anaerolineales bacterium]|nr:hypothetical protein [Anaerolineales bacterium]